MEILISGSLLAAAVFNKIRIDKRYHKIKLSNKQLLLGYRGLFKPLIADMDKTPHVLISGLSNSGKSKCVKAILSNLDNADIIIYNSFKEDYKGIKARYINSPGELNNLINQLLEYKEERCKPLYLVLEEMATIRDKKLKEKLQELLCVARHYNIYLIGVIQIATKESCLFKDLFNTRVSFRQIEDSNYRVVLGVSHNDEVLLNQGEFYLLSDGLYKGKTYII